RRLARRRGRPLLAGRGRLPQPRPSRVLGDGRVRDRDDPARRLSARTRLLALRPPPPGGERAGLPAAHHRDLLPRRSASGDGLALPPVAPPRGRDEDIERARLRGGDVRPRARGGILTARLAAAVLALAAAVLALAAAASPNAGTDWPRFRRDAALTGAVEDALPSPLAVLWTYEA